MQVSSLKVLSCSARSVGSNPTPLIFFNGAVPSWLPPLARARSRQIRVYSSLPLAQSKLPGPVPTHRKDCNHLPQLARSESTSNSSAIPAVSVGGKQDQTMSSSRRSELAELDRPLASARPASQALVQAADLRCSGVAFCCRVHLQHGDGFTSITFLLRGLDLGKGNVRAHTVACCRSRWQLSVDRVETWTQPRPASPPQLSFSYCSRSCITSKLDAITSFATTSQEWSKALDSRLTSSCTFVRVHCVL